MLHKLFFSSTQSGVGAEESLIVEPGKAERPYLNGRMQSTMSMHF